MASDNGSCKAANIVCPLPGGCEQTSAYGERTHPITGEVTKHWGVDLRAANGTEVRAPANGTIERVRVNEKTLPSGKVVGYGLYMVLRHQDGSATLYGHLQSANVQVGDRVSRGDLIALSDDSGGSTAPHLHLEYVPNGQIVQSKERIDPLPCIQEPTASGDITVRDNGSLADDAFAVHFDGILLGTTSIGGANSFAISNLLPGAHVLSVTGVIVPDNVGTYEVVLSGGITFSDGTLRRSGVVQAGETVNFSIIVPDNLSPTIAPRTLMRPNEAAEG